MIFILIFERFLAKQSKNNQNNSSIFRTTIPNLSKNASSVAKPMCGNIMRLGAPNKGFSGFKGGSVP